MGNHMRVVQGLGQKARKLVTSSLKTLEDTTPKTFQVNLYMVTALHLAASAFSQVILVPETHWAVWNFLKGTLQSENLSNQSSFFPPLFSQVSNLQWSNGLLANS